MASGGYELSESVFEETLASCLKRFPHISALKLEQKLCLKALVMKKDVFGILPTGFGKSLVYQLLPHLLKGEKQQTTVLVVSPLISIMKDQVDQLNKAGMKAIAIGIGDHEEEKNLRAGGFDVDLVYGSPECWLSDLWSKELRDGKLGSQIVAVVVDEAHSVSSWGQVSSKKKGKQQHPFREAFGRVKEIRSLVAGVPVLALTASVKLKECVPLSKACGMINPEVIKVSPNKENIFIGCIHITVESDTLKNLTWIADMLVEHHEKSPQTIIFCNTFTDIANVLSFLLMKLRNQLFINVQGKRMALLGVYHAKTWDKLKEGIESDFKNDGYQRVVIATCALGMGVNFPNVKYVVHYGPPRSTTEIIQQGGRAGRNGQQAFCYVYATNRQLALCEKAIKDLFREDSCLRVALYRDFDESVKSKTPLHLCCSSCKKKCDCEKCEAANNQEKLPETTPEIGENQRSCQLHHRSLCEQDKVDLKLSLTELKETYSSDVTSLFQEEAIHGFTDKLINDIVNHASGIFTGSYLVDNLFVYSAKQAADILEITQELFEDIEDFDNEMDTLHQINKQVSEIESYFLLSAMQGEANLPIEGDNDITIPELVLQF